MCGIRGCGYEVACEVERLRGDRFREKDNAIGDGVGDRDRPNRRDAGGEHTGGENEYIARQKCAATGLHSGSREVVVPHTIGDGDGLRLRGRGVACHEQTDGVGFPKDRLNSLASSELRLLGRTHKKVG